MSMSLIAKTSQLWISEQIAFCLFQHRKLCQAKTLYYPYDSEGLFQFTH